MNSPSSPPPSPIDIIYAADRLKGRVRRTPVLESEVLNDRVGGRILIKLECLQITGSFKIRGAFNRLLSLSAEERKRGIVAWSAGNHAQALAYVGTKLGIGAVILIPRDASPVKVDATREYGAKVILYDRQTQDREGLANTLAEASGATIVPPYDDAAVIAGQGTAGLELLEEAHGLNAPLDQMVVCVGGGGLVAGCALAAKARGDSTQFFAAEPVGYDGTVRSLRAGTRVRNDMSVSCSADALMTPTPGELTFSLNRQLLSGGFTVSNAAIADAMRFAFFGLHVVVEAGGAAALAAVLSQPESFAGRTTGILLTGGNVDANRFCGALSSASQGLTQ